MEIIIKQKRRQIKLEFPDEEIKEMIYPTKCIAGYIEVILENFFESKYHG